MEDLVRVHREEGRGSEVMGAKLKTQGGTEGRKHQKIVVRGTRPGVRKKVWGH